MRLLLVLSFLLLPAASAAADPVVSLNGSTVTVDGTAGREEIELSVLTGEYRVTNLQGLGRTITPGDGCRRISDKVVGCPRHAVTRGRLVLGAGDDSLEVRSSGANVPLTVFGQDGADRLIGTEAGDSLFGGDGQDFLDGAGGNDAIDGEDRDDTLGGGEGNDILDGGRADDSIDGGPGVDTVDYTGHTRGVDVDLDDVADDGVDIDSPPIPGTDGFQTEVAQPEKDNVRSTVENVLGTAARDSIIGSAAPNRLNGLGGDDRIEGFQGDDHIIGSSGADELDGGAHFDLLDYSDHIVPVKAIRGRTSSEIDGEGETFGSFERLVGGSGPDVLQFSFGTGNRLEGGPGDDLLANEPGGTFQARETVFIGGPGTDTVSYQRSSGQVTASLDGINNDGRATEVDLISNDVENLQGGFGEDVLIGNDGPNRLDGREGANRLEGRGGDDVLAAGSFGFTERIVGGPGMDVVSYADADDPVDVSLDGVVNDGQAGENDQLLEIEGMIGSAFQDQLTGDGGPNRIEGGAGIDHIVGGDGEDRINTVDGEADQVSCGAGTDLATLDLPDQPDPSTDCETFARAPIDEHPLVEVRSLRRGKGGRAQAVLRCPRAARLHACTGTLTLIPVGDDAATARRSFDVGVGRTRLRLGRLPAGRYTVLTAGADALDRPLTTHRVLRLR